MSVVDSSAVVAILINEPDAAVVSEALRRSDLRVMSAATFVEASIVLDRRVSGGVGFLELDALITRAAIDIVPIDEAQARLARDAYRIFGKGRHKAALNFGDCFTYALAKSLGEPILCKGKDFAETGAQVVQL